MNVLSPSSLIMLWGKPKLYLAFARPLNYCCYNWISYVFPTEWQRSSLWLLWDLRWIKAEFRMEKLGSWSQLVHRVRFDLLDCSNLSVWLEVTLGNNGITAELGKWKVWKLTLPEFMNSRELQVNVIQLLHSTEGKLRPRESESPHRLRVATWGQLRASALESPRASLI